MEKPESKSGKPVYLAQNVRQNILEDDQGVFFKDYHKEPIVCEIFKEFS